MDSCVNSDEEKCQVTVILNFQLSYHQLNDTSVNFTSMMSDLVLDIL
jgi:hypothetical protein